MCLVMKQPVVRCATFKQRRLMLECEEYMLPILMCVNAYFKCILSSSIPQVHYPLNSSDFFVLKLVSFWTKKNDFLYCVPSPRVLFSFMFFPLITCSPSVPYLLTPVEYTTFKIQA